MKFAVHEKMSKMLVNFKNIKIYLIISLVISLFIESSYSFFPLVVVFSCLLILISLHDNEGRVFDVNSFFNSEGFKIFSFVFLVALILDSLRVVAFGITPIFLFGSFFILLMYKKTFGLSDPRVLFAMVLLIGIVYSKIVGYESNVIFSLFLMFVFLIGFKLFQRIKLS